LDFLPPPHPSNRLHPYSGRQTTSATEAIIHATVRLALITTP
jgi:hypothetical protein